MVQGHDHELEDHHALPLRVGAKGPGLPRRWPFTVVVPPLQGMYDRAAMRAKDTARCTNCRRLQARVDALEAELAALKQVVAQLGQQLAAARKDSSTSSKPPSSDIVKPPKPPPPQGQDKRRIGGQPGHPKHERAAFPPEAINGGSFDHRLDACPSCGQDLRPTRTIPPRVVQQVDVRRGPAVDPGAPQSSGVVPALSEGVRGPAPAGHRSVAAWSGRR